jgi:hypothetical protein
MTKRSWFQKLLYFVLGTIFIVAGYSGCSIGFGNADNVYLKNIEVGVSQTIRQRALAQLDSDYLSESSFDNFRQNIFKFNYASSNAYRTSDQQCQFEVGGHSFASDSTMIDFSFNSYRNKSDLMLFPSFGANPLTEEECSKSIVIDSTTAKTILSYSPSFGDFNGLIGQMVTISNPKSSNQNAASIELKIASIIYLDNDKDSVTYINRFVWLSHGSSIYISKDNFDALGLNTDANYFTNLPYKAGYEYTQRAFYSLKKLLGKTNRFSFPDVDTNKVTNSKFSKMSEITDAVSHFEDNGLKIVLCILSIVLILVGFAAFVRLSFLIDFDRYSRREYAFVLFASLTILLPIGVIYLLTLAWPNLSLFGLLIPIVGSVNTLIYVTLTALFLLFCYLRYKKAKAPKIAKARVDVSIINI